MRRACAAALLAACAAQPSYDPTRVRAPRLVSVRVDPPEAAPGETARLSALVAAPEGVGEPPLRWALCLQSRAPTDSTAVPARCADEAALTPIAGVGAQVAVRIPSEACRVAGPEVPAGTRAPDPDATGGYYLAYRAVLDAPEGYEVAFARVRLRCARPDLSTDVARALAARSAPNRNPELLRIDVAPAGGGALRVSVTAGEAERYARVDARGASVEEVDETLEAQWFTELGAFRSARTRLIDGATSNELALDTQAPRGAVWVVVRDGRGGVAHERRVIAVPR